MPDLPTTAPFFAGIDVGGTNVKIGIVDDNGKIIADNKFPTKAKDSPDVAVEQAKRELTGLLADKGLDWDQVAAVGVGTPGPMDIKAGLILTPNNLPGWHNYPIREKLSQTLDKPVTFANDANAASFGEYWVGGGQAFASMILLTLGTGVGGGIIIDNFSIDGEHSHGAEIGHISIDTSDQARVCSCGVRGHLEAYASATALVDRTREALSTPLGSSSCLRKQTGDASPLSALMISNAAEAGDEFALKIGGFHFGRRDEFWWEPLPFGPKVPRTSCFVDAKNRFPRFSRTFGRQICRTWLGSGLCWRCRISTD